MTSTELNKKLEELFSALSQIDVTALKKEHSTPAVTEKQAAETEEAPTEDQPADPKAAVAEIEDRVNNLSADIDGIKASIEEIKKSMHSSADASTKLISDLTSKLNVLLQTAPAKVEHASTTRPAKTNDNADFMAMVESKLNTRK